MLKEEILIKLLQNNEKAKERIYQLSCFGEGGREVEGELDRKVRQKRRKNLSD